MAKRQGLLQQKDIRKLLCAILGLISPAKFDSSCTSYISRYISHKRMSSLKHITWHIFATYLHFKRKKRQKRIYMLWSSLYVCILISHIANIYRFNIQCYLPIHNLLIHYPRRFTVLYLFNKTSNSRNYKLNLSQFKVFPIYSIVNWEENHEFWVHGFQIHGKFQVPKNVI